MSVAVQRRRGTTAENNAFTGLEGEWTYDTDRKTMRTHDGSTAGGFEATFNTASQTLTNKTLASPVFSGSYTFAGTPTLGANLLSSSTSHTIGSSGAGVASIFFGTGTAGLDSYATSTWTPADGSGAGLTFSNVNGTYVKVGRIVMATGRVTYPATADASAAVISGLPFTTGTGTAPGAVMIGYSSYGSGLYGLISAAATTFSWTNLSGVNVTNANLSTVDLRFTVLYRTSS